MLPEIFIASFFIIHQTFSFQHLIQLFQILDGALELLLEELVLNRKNIYNPS